MITQHASHDTSMFRRIFSVGTAVQPYQKKMCFDIRTGLQQGQAAHVAGNIGQPSIKSDHRKQPMVFGLIGCPAQGFLDKNQSSGSLS
jgi:hypothetical protein